MFKYCNNNGQKHKKKVLSLLAISLVLTGGCATDNIAQTDPETDDKTAEQLSQDQRSQLTVDNWKTCENDNAHTNFSSGSGTPVSDMHIYNPPPPQTADEQGSISSGVLHSQTGTIQNISEPAQISRNAQNNKSGQSSSNRPQPRMRPPDTTGRNFTIVNGEPVSDINAYKWMAHLQIDMTDGSSILRSKCGGSLINKQWILTAAHCVDVQYAEDRYNSQFPAGSPRIRFDLHNISVGLGGATSDENGIDVIKVSSLTRFDAANALCHTGYNQTGDLENDIALLKLDSPVNLASYPNMETALLPAQGTDRLSTNPTNFITKPIGYGKTEYNTTSTKLLEIELTVDQTQTEATRFTAIEANSYGSICMGDSGGPTHIDLPNRTVIGLSSYVMGASNTSCNFLDVSSTFTRISAFRSAIDAAVNDCSANNICFQ